MCGFSDNVYGLLLILSEIGCVGVNVVECVGVDVEVCVLVDLCGSVNVDVVVVVFCRKLCWFGCVGDLFGLLVGLFDVGKGCLDMVCVLLVEVVVVGDMC